MNEPKKRAASSPLAACGAILACLALVGLARGYELSHRGAAPDGPAFARSDGGAPPDGGGTQVARLLEDRPVDVNRATAEELKLLPRIGPTLAARIVEERERGGPFRSVSDLTRVRGIGPRTVERLSSLATVGPRDAGTEP
jgi:competence protein ComEA